MQHYPECHEKRCVLLDGSQACSWKKKKSSTKWSRKCVQMQVLLERRWRVAAHQALVGWSHAAWSTVWLFTQSRENLNNLACPDLSTCPLVAWGKGLPATACSASSIPRRSKGYHLSFARVQWVQPSHWLMA